MSLVRNSRKQLTLVAYAFALPLTGLPLDERRMRKLRLLQQSKKKHPQTAPRCYFLAEGDEQPHDHLTSSVSTTNHNWPHTHYCTTNMHYRLLLRGVEWSSNANNSRPLPPNRGPYPTTVNALLHHVWTPPSPPTSATGPTQSHRRVDSAPSDTAEPTSASTVPRSPHRPVRSTLASRDPD